MDDYTRRDGSACAEAERPFVSVSRLQNDPLPVPSRRRPRFSNVCLFHATKAETTPSKRGVRERIFQTEEGKKKKGAARTPGRERQMQVKEGARGGSS